MQAYNRVGDTCRKYDGTLESLHEKSHKLPIIPRLSLPFTFTNTITCPCAIVPGSLPFRFLYNMFDKHTKRRKNHRKNDGFFNISKEGGKAALQSNTQLFVVSVTTSSSAVIRCARYRAICVRSLESTFLSWMQFAFARPSAEITGIS